jgi:hypothetical protein
LDSTGSTDSFTFTRHFVNVSEEIVSGAKRPTKREILSLLMSIFDPMGFISHFTIKAKILLQDIWRCEIGWDDELPTQFLEKWNNWIQELHCLSQVKIPRSYVENAEEAETIQLQKNYIHQTIHDYGNFNFSFQK